ncbi:MAG: transglutaminase domain-containing protein [Clostridia bacterium]|nr:transglutaminase domain-containing protein [Clostridia bacterium]
MKKLTARLLAALLLLSLLTGCAAEPTAAEGYTDPAPVEHIEIEEEAVALSASPAALPEGFVPVASGVLTQKNAKAVVDYSNSKDGYVMVQFTAQTASRIKAQVKGPATTYTYNVTPGQWTTFPLSDGNGSYTVTVFENVKDTKYAAVVSATFTAALSDEFAPFLRPNQYVDYAVAPQTVAKAAELVQGCETALAKVEKVYHYVVQNFTYDRELAATVQSGYLPVLDTVLEKQKGICFDYAALMTGMLRSQGVPCKLVVGYAGTAYHAWISVWSEGEGWIDGVIYFDGTTWQRMDPTFASSGGGSEAIMAYIGDGQNYSAKYFY